MEFASKKASLGDFQSKFAVIFKSQQLELLG
jgi:hypothetical protein